MSDPNPSSSYFQKVSAQWDSLRAGYFPNTLREALFEKAYLRPEMVAADVGAGTGFVSAALAPLVKHVHLLDASAAMLDVARANLSAFHNLTFHVTDGSSLTLPDKSVDVAFANMYLHHCSDPFTAIREIVRILKPGGRLLISDLDLHQHEWMKKEMADFWLGFERRQVKDWFRAADLVNITITCTGENCCANSEGKDNSSPDEAEISIFVASGTRRLHMRDSVQDVYSARAESAGCGCSSSGAKQDSMSSACCSSGSSNCCGDNTTATGQSATFITDYSPEERAVVPAEAEEISLGCGNPIALANLKPGEVVLDIGSGGGIDSFLSATRVGPSGRVIGVDMTPAMLDRARASALKNGIPNVEFRHGHAEELPVENSSVDVVISNCVINLCEDKGLVFEEAYRVLKPGGRLEVSDVVTDQAFPLDARADSLEWAECVSGALPEQEYLDLISAAGFTDVKVKRSTTSGEVAGAKVMSAIVSAVKPAKKQDHQQVSSCCRSSNCC